LVNTVQSEVSVGSKYWILSGLIVGQFSSENFKILKQYYTLIVFIIVTKNKSIV